MDYVKDIKRLQKIIIDSLKSIITPAFCVQCTVYLPYQDLLFCKSCDELIKPLVTVPLKITEKYTVPVYGISDYKNPLKSLILEKKNRQRNAAWQLGKLLWEKTDIVYADFDVIVPVPLHWTRYAWRWFNQAEVMANALSEKSGKPVIYLVRKKIKTTSQSELSRIDRLKNMCDVFELTDQAYFYKNKKLLFVDDVMTTGTTLKSVIKTCLALKPEKITIAVACRVV